MTDTQTKALSIMRKLSAEERHLVSEQVARELLKERVEKMLAQSANDAHLAALKLGISLPTLYRWKNAAD